MVHETESKAACYAQEQSQERGMSWEPNGETISRSKEWSTMPNVTKRLTRKTRTEI